MATTWGSMSPSTSSSHCLVWPMISSPDVVGATQFHFVLLGLTSAWIGGLAQSCCDSNSYRNSSRILSASFLISSINSWRSLLFISALVYWGEEDECRGATPKYSLIPTPCPAARVRPQCSGRPIASTRILWRPSGTKLPWEPVSYTHLTLPTNREV